MKKKVLLPLAVVLVLLLAVGAWFIGYYSQKNNDNIPSKELMVSYCQNQGEAYATEKIQGYKNTQLQEVWGDPDGSLSGLWGDIWEAGNGYRFIVHYNAKGLAEEVRLME